MIIRLSKFAVRYRTILLAKSRVASARRKIGSASCFARSYWFVAQVSASSVSFMRIPRIPCSVKMMMPASSESTIQSPKLNGIEVRHRCTFGYPSTHS